MKVSLILLVIALAHFIANGQDSTKVADTSRKFNERLAEVTVTARKPLMTVTPDKTIVDVKSMAVASSGNTLELLEKIPGITVSTNGDISLNGRAGVLVLIDGRSTYMSAQDLAAYLKSIPAGNLDKIELIDNPSSKYDASGNAVINIRLRKNRHAGLTGSIAGGLSQGTYFRSNNSVNLSYSTKKLNLFSNVGYGSSKEYKTDMFDRKFYDENDNFVSSVLLDNNQISYGQSINVYTGFDYAITKKSSIGASFNYNFGKRTGDFRFTSDGFSELNESTSYSDGFTDSKDKRKNINVNLNFLHQFNTNGHELTADANYLDYRSSTGRLQQNRVFDKNQQVVEDDMFEYSVPVNSQIYVIKSDYVKPFSKTLRMEAGAKSSIINNDNISDYYDRNSNAPVFVPANSDHFRYKENINAAYFNMQQSWKRVQAQLGVRMENLHAVGTQVGNDIVQSTSFTKNTTELFPSAFIMYKLDTVNKNNITLIAVRRINRPNYFQLNPFLFQKDEYTYTTGNPDLNPQFQYRMELKFQHKQLWWFGLSYNKFTRVIFSTTEAVGDTYIEKPSNVGKGFMVLLNTGLTWSPTKWWNLNYVMRVSHMGLRGNGSHSALRPTTQVLRFESYNYFTISKTVGAELGGYYASRDLNGQSITKQMFRMNANVQKKIFNDKGSVRIGVDDIFHSWRYRNYSVGLVQSTFYQVTETDTQRINIGFSYRFGKDSNNRKRRQGGVNEEEKGRLE